ncbi:hypothetical protein TNCV_1404091 [Trichonephila clavipes]|nr:hypothetical protein TNCV_1404091 [Trichonephila clavipes]
MECVYEGFARPAASVIDKNIEKVSVILFDSQGIIRKEFLPEGSTMKAARYIGVLTRFLNRLRRVRPQYAQQGSCFFIRDKARPHTANTVKQFLQKKWGGANRTSSILARF